MRAVLFDVDGTLYVQRWLRVAMLFELAAWAAVHPSRGYRVMTILGTYRRMHEELRGLETSGSVSQAQLKRTAERLCVPVDRVDALAQEWMARRPLKYLRWCRRRSMVRTLNELREAGLRLGILSDYPARDKLAALGVSEYFSLVLCTTDREINALKPDPRGFRRACHVWGLNPKEVLYVGDRPEVDGAGACAAGLPCVIVGARSGRTRGEWRHARGFASLRRAFAAIG